MNDFRKAKKSLDLILKKGDIYDTIATKENKRFSKHPLVNVNILLFSRLLYGVFYLGKRIKNYKAPIKKIKKAQDDIRTILGIPIDVINSRKNSPLYNLFELKKFISFSSTLSILYENEGIALDSYLNHLRKILYFCALHNIDNIFLKELDILAAIPDLNIEDYTLKSGDEILGCSKEKVSSEEEKKLRNLGVSYNIKEFLTSKYFALTPIELIDLIEKLEIGKLDKQVLASFENKIEDEVIKHAIATFLQNGNLEKLKRIVCERLTLALNSANTYKDKIYGKVFQNVKIMGEFIQVVTQNNKGLLIENKTISLYDYLEVKDYNNLLKKIEKKGEETEVFAISSLYLYLCQKGKYNAYFNPKKETSTLYDYFYQSYIQKQKRKITRIPGLNILKNKIINDLASYIGTFYIMFFSYALLFLLNDATELTRTYIFEKEDPTPYETAFEKVYNIYKESWKFEKKLLDDVTSNVKGFCHDYLAADFEEVEKRNTSKSSWDDFNNGRTGDTVDLEKGEQEIMATITSIDETTPLPTYFAISTAFDAHYFHGEMRYTMTSDTIWELSLDNVEPLFSVSHELGIEDVYYATCYDRVEFFDTFYPVGESYVITSITLKDRKDTSKEVVWNKENYQESLTYGKRELILSMEEPEICYTYGIDDTIVNEFVRGLKYGNYNFSSEEKRTAVLKGLGLEENANLEEIYDAIKNKKYSTTPIKDAKLTDKIESMSETEYFKTIASLDSLVCNLAATLAVGVEDNLIYTVGFLNTDDEFITANEAHAWGMRFNGEIVDVTPSLSKENNKIQEMIEKILDWGVEHNIPLYGVLLLIGLTIKKVFGKKITYHYKLAQAKNLVTKQDIEKSYANLNKFIYGKMTYPVKQTTTQFVSTIKNEFAGYTEEELKSLKVELLKNKRFDNKYLKSTIKLIDEIPFIVQNEEELKRILKKDRL